MFHLKDRSVDGFLDRSRLSRAPDVLGQAFALPLYPAGVWRNNATRGGVLLTPGVRSNDGAERIAANFHAAHAGIGNARMTIVLEQSVTWQAMAGSQEDAEAMASRRFRVKALCRPYQVSPPIVQDDSHRTPPSPQHAGLWLAQLTLTPWVCQIEAAFSRCVFDNVAEFHPEIDLSCLKRGDCSARLAAHAIAMETGILTARDARCERPRATTPVQAAARRRWAPVPDALLFHRPVKEREAAETQGLSPHKLRRDRLRGRIGSVMIGGRPGDRVGHLTEYRNAQDVRPCKNDATARARSGDWLSRRPWCQTRLDPASRQTNRASLGIDDLAAAWVALTR